MDTAGGAPIASFGTRSDAYLSPPRALRVQTTTASGIEQRVALGLGAATTGSVRVNVRVDGVAGIDDVAIDAAP